MQKKRIWAALLAATMVMGSLAGCGAKDSEDKSTSAEKTEVGSASESVKEETKELDTIRILGVDRAGTDNAGNTVYLSDWVNGDSKIWQQLTSDLAERGIQLELDLIAEDQYATVIQTQIAAGLDCDMVNIHGVDSKTRMNLIKQGVLVPVNEIWDTYSEEATKEFYTTGDGAVLELNTMEDGNIYWLSPITIGDYQGESWGSVKGAMIRKDWLDKLNIEMPETTDELYDALLAFQEKDANGNGAKDELTRASLSSFYNGIAQMFGLGTDLVCFTDYESGVVTSPWYQDGIKDYINFMKKLYDAGLLDTAESGTENKVENRLALICSWWAGTYEEAAVVVSEGQAGANYVGINCDPETGVSPVISIQDGIQKNSSYEVAFTSQANKEAVGRLLDYLCSEEFSTLTEYGIEGYSYKVVDGVKVKITDSEISEVQLISNLPALWTNNAILPRLEIVDRAQELATVVEAGYSVGYEGSGYSDKANVIKDIYENSENYVFTRMTPSASLAVATEDETQRSADLRADLDTYYKELLTKLIMGQSSMDDWDTYIAEMKELGLDELIEISQNRYDRANK
ncbi:MAG: extracellular solute-binding protein [Lachnospiraceae bacterium]|nr:extracellular solute-binding protein [Lachnospiraceae bacterium]